VSGEKQPRHKGTGPFGKEKDLRNHCLDRDSDLPELPPTASQWEPGRASPIHSTSAPGTDGVTRRRCRWHQNIH